MSTRDFYVDRAKSCLAIAEWLRDPAERAALLKVAACYMSLADYVAERQDHGTAHRKQDGVGT